MTLVKLALRAILFGLLLWWVISTNFSFFPSLLFVIVSIVLYAQPVFNTFELSISFASLLVLSFFTSAALSAGTHSPFLWALAFSALFYVLIGTKRVAFKHRLYWYELLHLTLVYAAFLLFFSVRQPGAFVLSSLFLWASLMLLLREFFIFSLQPHSPRLRLLVATLSLAIVELVWAIGLLPIGFLGAAGLALILFYMLEEMSHLWVTGKISRHVILTNTAIATLLAGAILFTSQWTL